MARYSAVEMARTLADSNMAITMLNSGEQFMLVPARPRVEENRQELPVENHNNKMMNPCNMHQPRMAENHTSNLPKPSSLPCNMMYQPKMKENYTNNVMNPQSPPCNIMYNPQMEMKKDKAIDTGYPQTTTKGSQVVDGRYTSTYQTAHCHVKPTSPPLEPREFPPQRADPHPGEPNFIIGESYTPYPHRRNVIRGRMLANSSTSCNPREFNEVGSFAASLRKYPSSYSNKSEILERFISYSQYKCASDTRSTKRLSSDSPLQETRRPEPTRPSLDQQYCMRNCENNDVSPNRHEMRNVSTEYSFRREDSDAYDIRRGDRILYDTYPPKNSTNIGSESPHMCTKKHYANYETMPYKMYSNGSIRPYYYSKTNSAEEKHECARCNRNICFMANSEDKAVPKKTSNHHPPGKSTVLDNTASPLSTITPYFKQVIQQQKMVINRSYAADILKNQDFQTLNVMMASPHYLRSILVREDSSSIVRELMSYVNSQIECCLDKLEAEHLHGTDCLAVADRTSNNRSYKIIRLPKAEEVDRWEKIDLTSKNMNDLQSKMSTNSEKSLIRNIRRHLNKFTDRVKRRGYKVGCRSYYKCVSKCARKPSRGSRRNVTSDRRTELTDKKFARIVVSWFNRLNIEDNKREIRQTVLNTFIERLKVLAKSKMKFSTEHKSAMKKEILRFLYSIPLESSCYDDTVYMKEVTCDLLQTIQKVDLFQEYDSVHQTVAEFNRIVVNAITDAMKSEREKREHNKGRESNIFLTDKAISFDSSWDEMKSNPRNIILVSDRKTNTVQDKKLTKRLPQLLLDRIKRDFDDKNDIELYQSEPFTVYHETADCTVNNVFSKGMFSSRKLDLIIKEIEVCLDQSHFCPGFKCGFRNAVVSLAEDILERHTYLKETNYHASNNEKELDYLKFQLFKSLSGLLGKSVVDLAPMLMSRLHNIKHLLDKEETEASQSLCSCDDSAVYSDEQVQYEASPTCCSQASQSSFHDLMKSLQEAHSKYIAPLAKRSCIFIKESLSKIKKKTEVPPPKTPPPPPPKLTSASTSNPPDCRCPPRVPPAQKNALPPTPPAELKPTPTSNPPDCRCPPRVPLAPKNAPPPTPPAELTPAPTSNPPDCRCPPRGPPAPASTPASTPVPANVEPKPGETSETCMQKFMGKLKCNLMSGSKTLLKKKERKSQGEAQTVTPTTSTTQLAPTPIAKPRPGAAQKHVRPRKPIPELPPERPAKQVKQAAPRIPSVTTAPPPVPPRTSADPTAAPPRCCSPTGISCSGLCKDMKSSLKELSIDSARTSAAPIAAAPRCCSQTGISCSGSSCKGMKSSLAEPLIDSARTSADPIAAAPRSSSQTGNSCSGSCKGMKSSLKEPSIDSASSANLKKNFKCCKRVQIQKVPKLLNSSASQRSISSSSLRSRLDRQSDDSRNEFGSYEEPQFVGRNKTRKNKIKSLEDVSQVRRASLSNQFKDASTNNLHVSNDRTVESCCQCKPDKAKLQPQPTLQLQRQPSQSSLQRRQSLQSQPQLQRQPKIDTLPKEAKGKHRKSVSSVDRSISVTEQDIDEETRDEIDEPEPGDQVTTAETNGLERNGSEKNGLEWNGLERKPSKCYCPSDDESNDNVVLFNTEVKKLKISLYEDLQASPDAYNNKNAKTTVSIQTGVDTSQKDDDPNCKFSYSCDHADVKIETNKKSNNFSQLDLTSGSRSSSKVRFGSFEKKNPNGGSSSSSTLKCVCEEMRDKDGGKSKKERAKIKKSPFSRKFALEPCECTFTYPKEASGNKPVRSSRMMIDPPPGPTDPNRYRDSCGPQPKCGCKPEHGENRRTSQKFENLSFRQVTLEPGPCQCTFQSKGKSASGARLRAETKPEEATKKPSATDIFGKFQCRCVSGKATIAVVPADSPTNGSTSATNDRARSRRNSFEVQERRQSFDVPLPAPGFTEDEVCDVIRNQCCSMPAAQSHETQGTSMEDSGVKDSSQAADTTQPKPKTALQINEELQKYLQEWCLRIPIKLKDRATSETARLGLRNGIAKQIIKIRTDPLAMKDKFLCEDMLGEEVDDLLDCLPATSELQAMRHMAKAQLLEFVVESNIQLIEAHVRQQISGQSDENNSQNISSGGYSSFSRNVPLNSTKADMGARQSNQNISRSPSRIHDLTPRINSARPSTAASQRSQLVHKSSNTSPDHNMSVGGYDSFSRQNPMTSSRTQSHQQNSDGSDTEWHSMERTAGPPQSRLNDISGGSRQSSSRRSTTSSRNVKEKPKILNNRSSATESQNISGLGGYDTFGGNLPLSSTREHLPQGSQGADALGECAMREICQKLNQSSRGQPSNAAVQDRKSQAIRQWSNTAMQQTGMNEYDSFRGVCPLCSSRAPVGNQGVTSSETQWTSLAHTNAQFDTQMNNISQIPQQNSLNANESYLRQKTPLQINEELQKYLQDWVAQIPIDIPDRAAAVTVRLGLRNGIAKQIVKIRADPLAMKDRFLCEDMLGEEVDDLLDCLPETAELQSMRHAAKAKLLDYVVESNIQLIEAHIRQQITQVDPLNVSVGYTTFDNSHPLSSTKNQGTEPVGHSSKSTDPFKTEKTEFCCVLLKYALTWCNLASTPENGYMLSATITTKVSKLHQDPVMLVNDQLYEQTLEHILEDVLDQYAVAQDATERSTAVKDIIKQLFVVRNIIKDEQEIYSFRQKVMTTLANKTNSQDVNVSKLSGTPAEKIADALILQYEIKKDAPKSSIADEVDEFLKGVKSKDAKAAKDDTKVKDDVIDALVKISAPQKNVLAKEAERIRMKQMIDECIKDIPVVPAKQAADKQLRANIKSVLANTILEIKRDFPPGTPDLRNKIKAATLKAIQNLQLQPGKDLQAPEYADQMAMKLMNMKKGEPSSKTPAKGNKDDSKLSETRDRSTSVDRKKAGSSKKARVSTDEINRSASSTKKGKKKLKKYGKYFHL